MTTGEAGINSMNEEKQEAIEIANKQLDSPSADPDSDFSIVCRQFIRQIDKSPDVERRVKIAKSSSAVPEGQHRCKGCENLTLSIDRLEDVRDELKAKITDLQTKLQEAEEANGHIEADLFCCRKKIAELEKEIGKYKSRRFSF